MTLAKAQACASAVIGAGYNVTVTNSGGDWKVRAFAPSISIPVAQADSLSINQVVTGLIAEIEYS